MENLIGKYVWIEEDEEHCWVAGKITSLNVEGLHVEASINIDKIEMEIDKNFHFMDVHPSCFEDVNDLLCLGEYNEPSILHVIRHRFFKDKICTMVGNNSILYLNPYKSIEEYENYQSLYTSFKDYFLKIQFEIAQKNDFPKINSDNLFYFTHKAYFDMLTQRQKLQNFIITGEPSSGKSHAFKSILSYLSFLSIEQTSKYDNPLESIIQDINNFLEAFGNIANNRNENSSRFTKYFDIFFNDKGKIISLKIYCYFLENSRVVKSSQNEANFHIFYLLINGSNDFEKKIYHIKEVNYFKFLKNCMKRSSSEKEDCDKFQKIKELFLKLKFSNEEVKSIFTILSGILYLGNIEFYLSLNGQVQIRDITIKDFLDSSVLLGIDQERLRYVLTKTIKGDKENLIENAYINLNKIAKVLYSKTFEYIVKKINNILKHLESNNKISLDQAYRIGIIEFIGFEKKGKNEFEQFCCNYANEVFNQYYVNYNFKHQQEEFIKENIDWTKVNFIDNCDLLNLIDNTHDSLFAVIEKDVNKIEMKNQLENNLNGKNSKIRVDNNNLLIKHYNGDVNYNIEDFVENNKDSLDGDISIVFEVSNHFLLRSFFKKSPNYITKLLRKKMRKLYKLLYTNSNILYVNCINPYIVQNEDLNFNSIYLNRQLKTIGLSEMLKIKKQFLPIKLSKEKFTNEYLQLMTNSIKINESNYSTEQIFKDLIKFFQINSEYESFFTDPLQLRIGTKNVYLDDKIVCFLKSKLNYKFLKKIIKFQSVIRKCLMINHMKEFKSSVIKIQINFKWRFILKKKKAKNQVKVFTQKIILNIPKKLKSVAKEYSSKISENEKMLSLQFNRIREIFHKSNKIKTEISINLLPDVMNNVDLIKSNTYDNSLSKDLNGSLSESKPKVRKMRRVMKTENIMEVNSVALKEHILNNTFTDEHKESNNKEKKQLKSDYLITESYFETLGLKRSLKEDLSIINCENFSCICSEPKESNPDYFDDIKNLKNMIMSNESTIEILNIKITELTKNNNFLNELNEKLKDQLSKTSEKWNKEIMKYHNQIIEIEIQKNEIERKYSELEKNSFSYHFALNESAESSKSHRENYFSNPSNDIFNYKKKRSTKKKEDILSLEKDISSLKTSISMKDVCINELQKKLESQELTLKLKNDECEMIKSKYEFCKNKITEFNTKLSGGKSFNEYENEIISLKNEFESKSKKNEALISLFTDKLEEANNNIEHLKKIGEVLKEELGKKEYDLNKRQELIIYIQGEIDKISNENSILKKENLSLKENINKLEINDIESKARHFNDMQSKHQENLILTSKIKHYEKLIFEIKEVLKKKQNLLTFKRSVNRMLIELLQLKKSEILLIEENNNSNNNPDKINDSISFIREKEKTLLNKMNNMANLQEYTTDSEDDSDEESQNKPKPNKIK